MDPDLGPTDVDDDADSKAGLPQASDERAVRRAALRDLAAMVGTEVFY